MVGRTVTSKRGVGAPDFYCGPEHVHIEAHEALSRDCTLCADAASYLWGDTLVSALWGFVDFMRQQQPDSGYLRLFYKVITDVWNQKQSEAVTFARTMERQVDELKERKRKLLEAMVYHQKLTRPEYDEMKIPVERDLVEAENALRQARMRETDVDAVLDFAEDLLLNAASVWERCSLD
jgi:hypothetical protein